MDLGWIYSRKNRVLGYYVEHSLSLVLGTIASIHSRKKVVYGIHIFTIDGRAIQGKK